ncbi:MAG: AAA family ATPase [Deltaproteobacteria bacterium]|jgi:predicted ATPase|nr:AAA family ATPase [Deltaproteobacteria bacterium]
MLFKSLSLKNFLSFGESETEISLAPLNIIIGPNGSGKSNFLEAFDILRNAPGDIFKPIRENGGFLNWFNKKEKKRVDDHIIEIGCSLQPYLDCSPIQSIPGLKPDVIMYSSSIILDKKHNNLNIKAEKISAKFLLNNIKNANFYKSLDYNTNNKQIFQKYNFNGEEAEILSTNRDFIEINSHINPTKSVMAQLRDPAHYPEITFLADILPKISIYRDWSFGRQTKPRLHQPTDLPNDFLLPDASNLGLILNKFRRDPATKGRLLEALHQLYDGIDDYDVQIEAGTVQVFFQESGRIIPATRLSDGTLRYLCLLAILLHPSPPPLICLEEPELGLHPDVLSTVAELIKEASSRSQLIVTTHSDFLVDAFNDQPEAVLVCERKPEGTTLRRLDRKDLGPWLEKYRLGELWTRGDIGGVRW